MSSFRKSLSSAKNYGKFDFSVLMPKNIFKVIQISNTQGGRDNGFASDLARALSGKGILAGAGRSFARANAEPRLSRPDKGFHCQRRANQNGTNRGKALFAEKSRPNLRLLRTGRRHRGGIRASRKGGCLINISQIITLFALYLRGRFFAPRPVLTKIFS